MMKSILIMVFVTAFCLVSCLSQSEQTNDTSVSDNLNRIAAEYLELRKIKGHFNGGIWDDRVDKFNGTKHVTMMKLAEAIEGRVISQDQLISLIGKPDAVKSDNSSTAWLYYWRGTHDYLIITNSEDGRIKTKWYFAYE